MYLFRGGGGRTSYNHLNTPAYLSEFSLRLFDIWRRTPCKTLRGGWRGLRLRSWWKPAVTGSVYLKHLWPKSKLKHWTTCTINLRNCTVCSVTAVSVQHFWHNIRVLLCYNKLMSSSAIVEVLFRGNYSCLLEEIRCCKFEKLVLLKTNAEFYWHNLCRPNNETTHSGHTCTLKSLLI